MDQPQTETAPVADETNSQRGGDNSVVHMDEAAYHPPEVAEEIAKEMEENKDKKAVVPHPNLNPEPGPTPIEYSTLLRSVFGEFNRFNGYKYMSVGHFSNEEEVKDDEKGYLVVSAHRDIPVWDETRKCWININRPIKKKRPKPTVQPVAAFESSKTIKELKSQGILPCILDRKGRIWNGEGLDTNDVKAGVNGKQLKRPVIN